MKLVSLSLFLLAMLASTAATADDSLSLENLRDLERVVAGHSQSFAACREYPCPDADCAGFQAARDSLSNASALIGTPQRTATETTWGDFERREKTLGYWMEQEWNAGRTHYDDLMNQAVTNMEKSARTETIAEIQKALINLSKWAQIVADIKGIEGLLRDQANLTRAPSTMQEIMAVNEILSAGSAMVEGAGMADQFAKDLKVRGENEGLPANAMAAVSYANTVQAVFAGVGNLKEAKAAAQLAMAQKSQLLALANKPLDLTNMSSTTARHLRTLERDALRRSFESNIRKSWEVADKAKSAGLLVAVKAATIFADSQQAELRDRIAEMKANLTAEEKALAEQAEGMQTNDARRLALLALKARVDEGLALLSDCEKSCTAPPAPIPPEIPVKSFSVPSTDASGNPTQRKSYGEAMKWFRQSFGSAAGAVRQAGPFRIEDSRMSLIPQPQRVARKAPIVIKAEGSICLLKRGKISGDGEQRNTSADNPVVTFTGKDKPGDYTYEYALRDVFDAGDDRYKTSTIVTVAKDGLLGYWRRTSPAMIINGRQEVVEWLKPPQGIVIAEDAGGKAVMAYVPIPNATLATAFTSKFAPKCTLSESALSCRFENDIGCAGQWYTLDVKVESDTTVRLNVSGGEVSNDTGQGCVRFPHTFKPFDFSLERETAGGTLETSDPCPDGFRCH